jgi:hypothetical protein
MMIDGEDVLSSKRFPLIHNEKKKLRTPIFPIMQTL